MNKGTPEIIQAAVMRVTTEKDLLLSEVIRNVRNGWPETVSERKAFVLQMA